MADVARFCTTCGAPLPDSAAFCTKCGAARGAQAAPAQAPVAQAPAAQPAGAQASTFVADASSAYRTATMVAGVAGVAGALPWQTVVGDQRADIGAFLSRAALPAAQQVLRASLKKPGLALAATTLINLVVAGLTGGMSAVARVIPMVLAGALTSVLSIVTGSKGGALRTITGVVSLVTSLVTLISLAVAFVGGLRSGAPLLSLAPLVVTIASSLTMSLKTAFMALRRRS